LSTGHIIPAGQGVKELPPLALPERYNYIAAFLTLSCNLSCSYCINSFGVTGIAKIHHNMINGSEWLRGLNRLAVSRDLPVTLEGGEPSLHPDFHDIINGLKPDLNIDILTNLQFDVKKFMSEVPPERITRDAPYASIRVSYHPEVMELDDVRDKVLLLLERGYSVGIWAVMHPSYAEEIDRAKTECIGHGIDFRVKEFLGVYEDRLFGTYRYPDSVNKGIGPRVQCRTSELIVGPTGHVFRCHSDLYHDREPIGHICDKSFVIEDVFRPCEYYGSCNPCDVKIKTDRFQQHGHTSVEILVPDRD